MAEQNTSMSKAEQQRYLAEVDRTRADRMRWWHEARFGMFIHWGLYAQVGRGEKSMDNERTPLAEYEKLAQTWHPRPGAAREWAAVAKDAGMKYMVLTTKHHEGFLLWDSKLSDYNAVRCGPGRDLVREYVEAAREFGLKVGFYYSLMDWHHPDGHACARDEAARRRFTAYTQGLVRELCSNYGKIDILWYDVSWPLTSPEAWESWRLNAMVRKLQPHILINDRSQLPEDFGTPEEHITAAAEGRAWEACMTFNGAWGWMPCPSEDWLTSRKVLEMLRTVTAGGGNLLLNIGPKPDGSVPDEARTRLAVVGKWLRTYGSVIYGPVDRASKLGSGMPFGQWTRKANTAYFWCTRWPGSEMPMGGIRSTLRSVRLLPDGAPLEFTQEPDRVVVRGLPATCPDPIAGVAVFEMVFTDTPCQIWSCGCELVEDRTAALPPDSPFVPRWQVSLPQPKAGAKAKPKAVRLRDRLGWQTLEASANPAGFANLHAWYPASDGVVYLANRFTVAQAGTWNVHLGHDGGATVFVDGRKVYGEAKLRNPVDPDRATFPVKLARGSHELVISFDLANGQGVGHLPAFHRRARQPRWRSAEARLVQ